MTVRWWWRWGRAVARAGEALEPASDVDDEHVEGQGEGEGWQQARWHHRPTR